MKALHAVTLILSLSFASAAFADEEAAVRKMLEEACMALERGEVERLRPLLHDRFMLTDTRGVVTGKDQQLAAARDREPRYTLFRNSDMVVHLFGDAAVITGITTLAGTAVEGPFNARLQFTDTAIKEGGRWLPVASHVSPAAN